MDVELTPFPAWKPIVSMSLQCWCFLSAWLSMTLRLGFIYLALLIWFSRCIFNLCLFLLLIPLGVLSRFFLIVNCAYLVPFAVTAQSP